MPRFVTVPQGPLSPLLGVTNNNEVHVNVLTLVGRLGADPELKTVGENVVANFSIATDRKEKGEKVTDWHRCSLWGKGAETLCAHLKKGDVVGVTGAVTYRTFEKNGEKRTATEIKANSFSFIPGAAKKAEDGEVTEF